MPQAEVLFRPESDQLRHLPEGPMAMGEDRLSWVAIQHGGDADRGSLNVLDAGGENATYELPGRVGFAFPQADGTFLAGVERHVCRLRLRDGGQVEAQLLSDEVDADVQGTIINDALQVPGGIVLGTKDLNFAEPKAGLYLWRESGELIRFRADQICSNGKDLREVDGQLRLLDIDSPTRKIVEYPLDLQQGSLGEPRVLLDLTGDDGVPDGMVLTPDKRSLIVALFNPGDPEAGEARQYSLDGDLEIAWTTPLAPRVTCPQLIRWNGRDQLVLTTAVEGMEPARLERHANSGCLFITPL